MYTVFFTYFFQNHEVKKKKKIVLHWAGVFSWIKTLSLHGFLELSYFNFFKFKH